MAITAEREKNRGREENMMSWIEWMDGVRRKREAGGGGDGRRAPIREGTAALDLLGLRPSYDSQTFGRGWTEEPDT